VLPQNHNRLFLLCTLITLTVVFSACAAPATPAIAPTQEILPTNPISSATVEEIPTLTPSETVRLEPTASPVPPTPTPDLPVPPTPIPDLPVPPIAGIEIHRTADLDLVEQTGLTWIRRNALDWAVVEPVEGERNWGDVESLDQQLERISSNGMQAILIIRDTPEWARIIPTHPCGRIMPDKLAAFTSFMHDAVVRYSAAPYNVKYWEIWNEPDVDSNGASPDAPFGCWGDGFDTSYFGGGYYADMLKVVYPEIKAVNPELQVLVGGLLLDCDPVRPPETSLGSGKFKDCTPARYLEGILANGGGDYFDGISFHAYDYYYGALGHYSNGNWHSAWDSTGPVLIVKVRYIRSLLAAFGYSNKYIMNTENALLCSGGGQGSDCFTEEFSETKAYYLVQSYTAARAEGLVANIWYDLYGWRGSGLVDEDGQPLPAYRALVFNTQELDQVVYRGEVTNYPGVRGYEFQRSDKIIMILWSADGESHLVALPEIPTVVYDPYGITMTASQELEITLTPIYLEWSIK
jgi:hypothetical protein